MQECTVRIIRLVHLYRDVPGANDNSSMQKKGNMDQSVLPKLFVTDPNPHDVLLGRGSHLVKYEGNIEFRRLIHERKDEYISSVRHSQKDHIARDVINKVKSRNGRFLRKVDNPMEMKKLNIPANITSAWVHVDEGVVVEKIKQAFRDSCKEGSLSDLNQDNQESHELSTATRPAGIPSKSLKKDTKLQSDSRRVAQSIVNSSMAEKDQPKQSVSIQQDPTLGRVETASLPPTQRESVLAIQRQQQEDNLLQLLLQHQQNQLQEQQRLLFDQLATLEAASNPSQRALDVSSTRLGNPRALGNVGASNRIDESNPLNSVNNMWMQQLQATALQRSLNSQLSPQHTSTNVMGEQSQRQEMATLMQAQLGIRPGDIDIPRSIQAPPPLMGSDQSDILQSLQRHRMLEQLSNANDLPLSHQHFLLGGDPMNRLNDLAAMSSHNRMAHAMLLSSERRSAQGSAALDFLNQELLLRAAGAHQNSFQYSGGIRNTKSYPQRNTDTATASSASPEGERAKPKRAADVGGSDEADASNEQKRARKRNS